MEHRPSFEGLPTEIVEGIVALLAFSDVCQLRLTTREVAAKSSQGGFKVHFAHKTIHLCSDKQLGEFGTVTQGGWLGCALQHLSIVGLASSGDQASQVSRGNDQVRVDLLATGLRNLPRRRLDSLVLAVECQTEDAFPIPPNKFNDWKSVWESAGRTLKITSQSLQSSAVQVEKFDAFGSVDRCSLDSDRIGASLDLLELSTSLRALRDLSLSISHREACEIEAQDAASAHSGGQLSQNIIRFLRLCPGVERLRLSWFNLRLLDLTETELEEQQFFNNVTDTEPLESLQEITLQGIYTNEGALLSFLSKHQDLRKITFEQVHLKSGSFGPVFAYVADNLNQLDSLNFDDLWESRLIQFPKAPGEPHFPHPGGPTWIARRGAETRKQIKYQPLKGRIKASAKASLWRSRKQMMYGPP